MQIKKVYGVYLSPTGTTQKATVAFAAGTGLPFEKIDLTSLKTRQAFSHSFTGDELLVAGLPVYGGRLPKNLDDFFSGLKGNGAPAVALVMYGNREYDDALIELKLRLEECGFTVKAGAAFIGEHTFSHKIATGRPDENDLTIAAGFGKQVADFISSDKPGTLTVKGNYPYKMPGYEPDTPGPHPTHFNMIITDTCTQCGICVEDCPWGAIDEDYPKVINLSKCMRCLRCLNNCPAAAIQIKDEKFLSFIPQFETRLNASRKEPELFLPR